MAVAVGTPMGQEDHLAWHDIDVDGRPAVYGVGGQGLPVLFLHGWGLGHRAYKRALRRLAAKGCRVYAPALPGFGGTAELPSGQRTLAGYAAWVAAFLDAVDVDEPVFLLGHSFGGGVAIELTYCQPERTRYLVLLNSVGGNTDRPLWDWMLQMGRELSPVGPGAEWIRAAAVDLVPNIIRRPRTVWEVGQIARHADLTPELEEIRRRKVPVLVLSSDHDEIIPLAWFDSLCATIGVEGQVVAGRHSWLIANPDAFGEVLDNVLTVQVSEHDGQRSTASGTAIEELLRNTSVPSEVARGLVADAAPLWLMSEPAAVLAADLALCHPPLRRNEVRAAARPLTSPHSWRLAVVAHDRPGLLADTAAVLAEEGLSVMSASAVTFAASHLALHALTFEAPDAFGGAGSFDNLRWDELGRKLQTMDERPAPRFVPRGPARVSSTGQDGRNLLRVTAPDQVGLLWAICRWMADHNISIEAASAMSAGGMARDVFLVDGECLPHVLAEDLSPPLGWRRRSNPLCRTVGGVFRGLRSASPV